MKTINIITPHFIPENSPCTNRIKSYFHVLSQEYRLNIITLTEKGKRIPIERKEFNNTSIHYIEQKNYNSKNFLIRAFNEIKYSYKLIIKSKQLDADYNIVTIPYMFLIPFSLLIRGVKILDIRDIVWEYLNESNKLNKIIKLLLKIIMINSLRQFNLIIVTNTKEENYLLNLKVLPKIELISNGIEELKYNKLANLSFDTNKFTVTYVGNIGLAQKIGVLLEVAKNLLEIDFFIIGDGVERRELEERAKEINLKNIFFLGKVNWEELNKYYSKTSLLFAQLDYGFDSAVPSKLYEYAATGLPILYAGVGEAVNFIKVLENSYVIEPNSSDTIIKKIKEINDKKQVISFYNRNFIKENFIREKNSKKLLKILENYYV
ncbi:glycosyltransferase [Aliarcobacter butzleri]|uniref:glycosyltransferase n=1 Tax=Aliarcobacter butzleri TaxID=28197 RepID=UPI0021B418D8|nr:glycosyltransferase [Aliarcobacter butzleri]MCT7653109.1 glycosyltransferase [Aliarcobacter butzleri]MDN5045615.1 glycosyltransferase [Aliarcobacter butzleri]